MFINCFPGFSIIRELWGSGLAWQHFPGMLKNFLGQAVMMRASLGDDEIKQKFCSTPLRGGAISHFATGAAGERL